MENLEVYGGYLIGTVFAHNFNIIKGRRGGGDEVPCIMISSLGYLHVSATFSHLGSFCHTVGWKDHRAVLHVAL
jgi:hypothetical protein